MHLGLLTGLTWSVNRPRSVSICLRADRSVGRRYRAVLVPLRSGIANRVWPARFDPAGRVQLFLLAATDVTMR